MPTINSTANAFVIVQVLVPPLLPLVIARRLCPASLQSTLVQGFKSRPGTAGFRVFLPFPVRSGMVNQVRFFIFYASKSKNTKVIFY